MSRTGTALCDAGFFLVFMQSILIVDGHSAIFATEYLLQLHRDNPGMARTELHRELTRFQDTSSYAVVLVFDGKGHDRDQPLRGEEDIMVIYSKTGETADTVIERLAARFADKYQLVVASNDRMVLDCVSAFGATPSSIRSMWAMIDHY
ncbi:NYN domain-containing protein [Rubritalea squalenifaciens]|nr:NYN domain-containing protein [Rubritalea squalenifaciens]